MANGFKLAFFENLQMSNQSIIKRVLGIINHQRNAHQNHCEIPLQAH